MAVYAANMTVARMLLMGSENLPPSEERQALFQEAFGLENKGRAIPASQPCNCLSGRSIWQIGRPCLLF